MTLWTMRQAFHGAMGRPGRAIGLLLVASGLQQVPCHVRLALPEAWLNLPRRQLLGLSLGSPAWAEECQ